MANTLKLIAFSGRGDKYQIRNVQITLTGSYVQVAGVGEVIDLSTITNPSGIDGGKQFASRRPIAIYPLTDNGGNSFEFIPVANQPLQYQLKVYVAGGTEMTAVTYASVGLNPSTTPILFEFICIQGA